MIKLQRIGHILISVRDVERSKAFYTDILGFKVLEQDPNHGGVFLSLGEHGNTLDLFPSSNPDAYPQPKSNPDVTQPYVMYPGTPYAHLMMPVK